MSKILTQGRQDYNQWVTSYKVASSNNGRTFKLYKKRGRVVVKCSFLRTQQICIYRYHILRVLAGALNFHVFDVTHKYGFQLYNNFRKEVRYREIICIFYFKQGGMLDSSLKFYCISFFWYSSKQGCYAHRNHASLLKALNNCFLP